MALDPQHGGMLSDESARRLLMRAAELDGGGDPQLSIPQVRQIAVEAGISPHSFQTALQELAPYLATVDSDHMRNRSSANRPPLWVRLCMFGVPDRRIATGYYWLFLAGLVAFPILTLLVGTRTTGAVMALMIGEMAFCTFAIWSTSRAIRWLDRHNWDVLED
jgi:hypothetical protein